MRLRIAAVLAAGVLLLVIAPSAGAVKIFSTKLTVDSSADVGDGVFVYSGRLSSRNYWCADRPLHLMGERANGKTTELDWALTSIKGAWALTGSPGGFKEVRVEVFKKKLHHPTAKCEAASISVFPPTT